MFKIPHSGSFSPSLTSPHSAVEDVPGTPQSRRKFIRQALESERKGNHRSGKYVRYLDTQLGSDAFYSLLVAEPVTPSRRRTRQVREPPFFFWFLFIFEKQTGFHCALNDRDEEQEGKLWLPLIIPFLPAHFKYSVSMSAIVFDSINA